MLPAWQHPSTGSFLEKAQQTWGFSFTPSLTLEEKPTTFAQSFEATLYGLPPLHRHWLQFLQISHGKSYTKHHCTSLFFNIKPSYDSIVPDLFNHPTMLNCQIVNLAIKSRNLSSIGFEKGLGFKFRPGHWFLGFSKLISYLLKLWPWVSGSNSSVSQDFSISGCVGIVARHPYKVAAAATKAPSSAWKKQFVGWTWGNVPISATTYLDKFHQDQRFNHMDVSKNRGIFPPKWMVKIMVPNPMYKWMIWGVFPYFWFNTLI